METIKAQSEADSGNKIGFSFKESETVPHLQQKVEYLKSVVCSAEKWQKRSWIKRTFYTWKKPAEPEFLQEICGTRPNFLIAGVPKAGTTSLYEYLRQHPDVFMSEVKEPTYFVQSRSNLTWKDYLSLFSGAKTKAIGEASACYLPAEESPALIKSALGNVKIIVLLRDPAERAFSQYCWMVREGYEDATTFSEALRREPLRLKDARFQKTCRQFFQDYLYFQVGLYCENLERFLKTFGPDHVRVYLFEDLSTQPLKVCSDIFQFLDIDPSFLPTIRIHNEGRRPKSIRWQYALRTHLLFKPTWITKLVGKKRLERMMEQNLESIRPKADPYLLQTLRERYRADIERLQVILGRDLSHWLKK